MNNLSTPLGIKAVLHNQLGKITPFTECALLDYPLYPNIGDHLIWLGTLFYLTDILKAKINYTASVQGFCASAMEKKNGKAPILVQGGGNFGDLYPIHQKFREEIVDRYCDRPVIILPQSIYFKDSLALDRTAKIFNNHPNLTLFVRDNYSYDIACQAFTNCHVIKAPDMAFQMVNMPGLSSKSRSNNSILYHCRQDQELNPSFSVDKIGTYELTIEDWVSYQWIYRETLKNPQDFYWRIPGSVKLFREYWQRGLAIPSEWVWRQGWEKFHPFTGKLTTIEGSFLHQRSWSLMYSAVCQFKRHQLIITNRLHGHILCILLGIPHVFLPNSYHKNESFYQTWTNQIPVGTFIKHPTELKLYLQQLITHGIS